MKCRENNKVCQLLLIGRWNQVSYEGNTVGLLSRHFIITNKEHISHLLCSEEGAAVRRLAH